VASLAVIVLSKSFNTSFNVSFKSTDVKFSS
jgi:hypothetical protein